MIALAFCAVACQTLTCVYPCKWLLGHFTAQKSGIVGLLECMHVSATAVLEVQILAAEHLVACCVLVGALL